VLCCCLILPYVTADMSLDLTLFLDLLPSQRPGNSPDLVPSRRSSELFPPGLLPVLLPSPPSSPVAPKLECTGGTSETALEVPNSWELPLQSPGTGHILLLSPSASPVAREAPKSERTGGAFGVALEVPNSRGPPPNSPMTGRMNSSSWYALHPAPGRWI
jgi:hypothetical protein